MQKKIILFLIICSCAVFKTVGQNLYLHIKTSDSSKTHIADSLNYLKKHKDYNALANELDTLKIKLNRLGYIDASWSPLKKENDSVFETTVNYAKPYTSISVFYDLQKLPKSTLKRLQAETQKSFFTIPFNDIEQTLQFINTEISKQGLPFNRLKLQNIQKQAKHTLKADLVISGESQKRFIDKIVVKGYEAFPDAYLKYYLKLRTGQLMNLSEVKLQTSLLQELNFAKQIKDSEILFSKDSTILYVYIDKTKSNAFDGFLGFGTNEETSKLELTGYLNLELSNNLNYGETLSLAYRSDESDQKSFNANIKLPYLFNTPIGTELNLQIFKKDTSFTTARQSAKINYQLSSKNEFSVGIKSIKSNSLLSQDNLNPFIQDYQTTFYNMGYHFKHQNKDGGIFKRNSDIRLETGFGTRSIKNVKNSQVEYSMDAFKIFNLNRKNDIFLKISSFGLFSDTYLENELTRFGGINSIRGFEENSLPASFYALLISEYRYSLTPSLYVHSIIDFAYFENQIIQQKEKLYSFGFGFGLATKAGLLRFNYANGKSENQSFKLSNSKIHLSLSALF